MVAPHTWNWFLIQISIALKTKKKKSYPKLSDSKQQGFIVFSTFFFFSSLVNCLVFSRDHFWSFKYLIVDWSWRIQYDLLHMHLFIQVVGYTALVFLHVICLPLSWLNSASWQEGGFQISGDLVYDVLKPSLRNAQDVTSVSLYGSK